MSSEISEQEMNISGWAIFRQNHIAAEGTGRADDTMNIRVFDIVLLYRVDKNLFGNLLFSMNQAIHALQFMIQLCDSFHRLDLALQHKFVIRFDQKVITACIYAFL